MKKIWGILTFALLVSCKKEAPNTINKIDPQLEVYLENFYKEAELRGVIISRQNLILETITNNNVDYCGLCTYNKSNKNEQRRVSINIRSNCWDVEPEQNREALVFHELGHCLLNREHIDDLFEDGSMVSMMHSHLDGPYQPCIYVLGGQNEVVAQKCRELHPT